MLTYPFGFPKPVIFLAFANPKNDLGRLAEEHKQIRRVLGIAEEANLCQVIERFNVDIETIFDVFQRKEYRNRIAVFHYGGHAGDYTLLLQKSAINSKPLDEFLARQESMQLVFLNGCSTQKQAENLLDKKIPAVIATSQAIDDKLATEFAIRFYSGFAQGLSIEQCFADAGDLILSAQSGAGASRHLHGGPEEEVTEVFSWKLYKDNEEAVKWNLPTVVNDPYFGLPPLPKGYLPNEPFLGLKPYTPSEAQIFFGRGNAIRNLYLRLTDAESEPLLLFYGQSGAGKSSLLDAGLLPRLNTVQEVCYARRDKASGLAGTLQQLLQAEKLAPEALLHQWKSREEKGQKPLTLILDQVEEVFARFTHFPAELEDFISLLSYIFASPHSSPKGKLVLGYRKEYHAEMEAICFKHNIPFTSFFLEPLTRPNAIEVISGLTFTERTRTKYNLSIEEGLAEDIAGDLAVDTSSPIAPVLQILMIKMWKEACAINKNNPRFSNALYNQLRMQGTGLSDFLDQQLASVKVWNKKAADSGLALDLLYFHTTNLGTADSQTLATIKAQYIHEGELILELVAFFKDKYLLTDTFIAGEPATRLAHDTLAPLIRARFDASLLPGQKAYRVLKNREADWQVSQQDNHLSERELENVEKGAAGMRAWNAHEQSLINVSRIHRNKASRTRKILWATFGILVIGVFISAGVAWVLREKANQQATIAHAQQLAAQARVLADQPKQLQRAALLAIESVNTYASLEGDQVMRYLLDKMLSPAYAVSHQSRHKEVQKVSFSQDNKYLISASNSEDILLLLTDITSGKTLARLETDIAKNELLIREPGASNDSRYRFTPTPDEGLYKQIEQLQFSKDAKVVYFTIGPHLWMWKWQTSDQPMIFTNEQEQNLWAYNFAIDTRLAYAAIVKPGKLFSDGLRHNTIDVFDVSSSNWVKVYSAIAGSHVNYIEFSPTEPLLAVGMRDGTINLWDLTKKSTTPYATFVQQGGVTDIAFHANGEKLSAVGPDGMVAIWDVKSKSKDPVIEVGQTIIEITSNKSGNTFASYNSDGTVSMWQAETGQELFRQQLKGVNTGLTFCGDDKYVAILCDGDDVKLYDSQSGELFAQVPNDADVYAISASPDGKYLATADANGMARLWQVHNIGTLATLHHPTEVQEIKLSDNGQSLITRSQGDAYIWDPATGQQQYRLQDNIYEFIANKDASRFFYTFTDTTTFTTSLRAHDRKTQQQAFTLFYSFRYVFHRSPAEGVLRKTNYLVEIKPPAAGYTNLLKEPYREKVPIVYIDSLPPPSSGLPDSIEKVVELTSNLDHLEILDSLHEGNFYIDGLIAVSPDGNMMAFAIESDLYLCDTQTGSEIAHLPHGYEATTEYSDGKPAIFTDQAYPFYWQFSEDGRYLLSLTNKYVLRIWDMEKKQYKQPVMLKKHIDVAPPYLRASYPYAPLITDNPYLVVKEDSNQVALLDFPSLNKKQVFTTRGKFEFFSFSRDNRLLATVSFSRFNSYDEISGNADSFIEIWDVATGRRLHALTVGAPVHHLSFSPDNQHLATADQAGLARVWNLQDRKEVSRITHKGSVQKALFTADGKILITTTGPTGKENVATHSQEVKLSYWQINELTETLSAKIIRNLSREEWEQYFPDVNYRKTLERLP